jgi:hypothetical protein
MLNSLSVNNQPKTSLKVSLLPGLYFILVNNSGQEIVEKLLVN